MSTPLLSNLAIYRAIAEEANAEAQSLYVASRTPKPDGSPGAVIQYDPFRRSFKQSLIAIVFTGIYVEALLYILGTRKFGERWEKKIDRNKTYEQKLEALGVRDPELLNSATRFRLSRKDLVHEKAVPVENLQDQVMRQAQSEAAHAIEFLGKVTSALTGEALYLPPDRS
jgi:hypothetical protein